MTIPEKLFVYQDDLEQIVYIAEHLNAKYGSPYALAYTKDVSTKHRETVEYVLVKKERVVTDEEKESNERLRELLVGE
jgi:hypothetical protein